MNGRKSFLKFFIVSPDNVIRRYARYLLRSELLLPLLWSGLDGGTEELIITNILLLDASDGILEALLEFRVVEVHAERSHLNHVVLDLVFEHNTALMGVVEDVAHGGKVEDAEYSETEEHDDETDLGDFVLIFTLDEERGTRSRAVECLS